MLKGYPATVVKTLVAPGRLSKAGPPPYRNFKLSKSAYSRPAQTDVLGAATAVAAVIARTAGAAGNWRQS